jgi:hypothetical protein
MLADYLRTVPRVRGLHLRRGIADRGLVACGLPLRPLRSTRFRRSRGSTSTEELTGRIAELVAERQELRARGARDGSLERNRLRIARAQWELAHALIDRHLPRLDGKSAA